MAAKKSKSGDSDEGKTVRRNATVYISGDPQGHPLIYANHFDISTTPFDCQIRLNRVVRIDQEKAEVQLVNNGTLAVSPETLKALVDLLTKVLTNFEQQYGAVSTGGASIEET